MGIGFCMYTIFMWVTELDSTYLHYGEYLDIVIIILPIFIIFKAIKQQSENQKITILNRLTIALIIGLISYIIYQPFLYFYHHIINPTWFDSVLKLKEAELKSNDIAREEMYGILIKMKESEIAKAPLINISSFISSTFILPCLIAIISSIFLKNKKSND